jgi:two-component system response regulator FixJ
MSLIAISQEILIVDDDVAACASLSMTFTLEGYRVMTFRDGKSFLAAARARTPACVLLDVYMPAKSGLEVLEELDPGTYPAPIFIMSARGDIPTAVKAIKGGAHDFIEKRLDAGTIVALVRDAINGWPPERQRGPDGGAGLSLPFAGGDRLTIREHDVLNLIARAASSKEAARILGISPRTVENHRVQIMQKLGAKNTADLVRIVLNNGAATRRRA